MKRIEWLSLAFAVVGLGCVGGTPCEPSDDPTTCKAGGFCHPELKICVAGDGGGATGGGSTGGGTGGGSTGGGTGGGMTGGGTGGGTADAGQCAVHTCDENVRFCVEQSVAPFYDCRLRWSGIEILSPTPGSAFNATTASNVEVRARLLDASGADGGGVRPSRLLANGAVLNTGAGVYTGTVGFTGTGPRTITVTADLDGGALMATTAITVDTDSPGVTLSNAPPPSRAPTGVLIEQDPAPGYAQAFKKNEVVEVRVEATERVVVSTSDFGAFSGFMTSRPMCSTCPAVACSCFDLDLAKVPLLAPRGDLVVNLNPVQDAAGNSSGAVAPLSLKVTRWKWKRTVATTGMTVLTPAVAENGDIFVATALSTASGGIQALSPSGSPLVGFDAGVAAAVTTAPLVSGGSVYFATKDAADGRIRKASAASGAPLGSECVSSSYTFNSALAVMDLGMSPEAVVGVASNGELAAARVGAPSAQCRTASLAATTQRYSVVSMAGNVFAAHSQAGNVVRTPWNSTTLQWGSSSSNSTSLFTQGLVAFGTTIGGGGGGGVNTAGVWALKSDGPFVQRADFVENGAMVSPASPAVVGGTAQAPRFIYGNNAPAVVRVDYAAGDPGAFDGGVTAATAPSQAVTTAPLVGSDEVYVVDSRGGVYVYDLGLGYRWSLVANGVGGLFVDAHPNLDVRRDSAGMRQCGRGGVLYVPSSGDGALYAFIVDSDGLKQDAPWPRWQHDPANSGNPATRLEGWTCP